MPNRKLAPTVFRLLGSLHELRGLQAIGDLEPKQQEPDLDPIDRESEEPLERAFDAALDILKLAVGPRFSIFDRSAAGTNLEGVTSVFAAHDLLSPAVVKHEAEELIAFRAALKNAISQPQEHGRRLVNELMDASRLKHPLARQVNRAIDRVNLGRMKWERFVIRFESS